MVGPPGSPGPAGPPGPPGAPEGPSVGPPGPPGPPEFLPIDCKYSKWYYPDTKSLVLILTAQAVGTLSLITQW